MFFEYCQDKDKIKWLLLIPKIMWEASKAKDKELCVLGAMALLKLLQCANPLDSTQKEALQLQFVPIFAIPTEKRTIWGPYVSCGRHFQSCITSALHYVEPMSETLVKSLAMCALHKGLTESMCDRLLGAVTFGLGGNPSLQLSFFSSLILKGCLEKGSRADTIKEYICRSLKATFSDYQDALLLLQPHHRAQIIPYSVNDQVDHHRFGPKLI